MVEVYTHSNSPFHKEFWKAVVRTMLRKHSGPQAVRDSLFRGLAEHGVSFTVNPLLGTDSVVLVLSGIEALRQQIKRKRAGKIKRLIAGPNLVVTPRDADGILVDGAIDYVLVPSQWVKDHYVSVAPPLNTKIVVWPAGSAKAPASTRSGSIILYYKDNKQELFNEAAEAIHDAGYAVLPFHYGSYTYSSYLKALETAKALVFISPSESQGLALQEAWMRDVPTFVHYTGKANTSAFTWHDEKINAPYLVPELGALYTDRASLASLLTKSTTYHPQEYATNVFSDYASAERLLSILR